MQIDVERDEAARVSRLVDAEARASDLFTAVLEHKVVVPGVTERRASDAVRDLAAEMFGVGRWWHKRIVRSGPNTLRPARENPPDRVLEEDDIVFLDFGPIFEEWEADFGRTYVLGSDPIKVALRDSLSTIWNLGRDYFAAKEAVTGDELYAHICGLADAAGWLFGGHIAGHLVGQFPHEKISGDAVRDHIMPGSYEQMRRVDNAGLQCHWILEVHLVTRDRTFGGFFEQLLDIGPNA